jgi:hypothetical protein
VLNAATPLQVIGLLTVSETDGATRVTHGCNAKEAVAMVSDAVFEQAGWAQ